MQLDYEQLRALLALLGESDIRNSGSRATISAWR